MYSWGAGSNSSLSRCFLLSVGEEPCGCDVSARFCGLDIFLGLLELWPALAGGDLPRSYIARQLQQFFGQTLRVVRYELAPLFGRNGDEHAFIATLDALGQMICGDLELRLHRPYDAFYRSFQQSHDIVGQQRHGKAKQGRAWMPQAWDLAVQSRFQAMEHMLDPPAPAIQGRDCRRIDLGRQVAPDRQLRLACLGRRVQRNLDATPPGFLGLRIVQVQHLDGLFAHSACLHMRGFTPSPLLDQARMRAVLADDEAGPRLMQAEHNRQRTEIAIRDPALAGLGA